MSEPLDNKKPEDVERTFARLEEQLLDIESAEIVHGMSQHVLEEKGFLGEKKGIEGKKSPDAHEEETGADDLMFKDDIVCTRMPAGTALESLIPGQFEGRASVQKDQLIAFKPANAKTRYAPGTNVTKTQTGKGEVYAAGVAGWVVVLNESLCVFPCDQDCAIEVRIAKDKLSAMADFFPGRGTGKKLSKETVLAALAQAGVKAGVAVSEINSAIDVVNRTGATQKNVAVAKAKLPMRGSDGKIELKFNTQQQEYDFKILPDGRIDYKNSVNLVTVKKNDLLAVIIPPVPAVPGTDVFGAAIPIAPSKEAMCCPGAGVRAEKNGRELYAMASGLVMFHNNVLEVVEVFSVDSDVDFSTGNINFNGTVLVNGDIKEGFEVKAAGDIVVKGNVESARIEAGRDVIIRGGVISKGKGLVSAGRNISADYVQNARIEAQGTITLGNFAVNSYLCTSQKLIMKTKRGAVIGGEVYAQKGLDVRTLGSDAGIKTFVEAGTDFLVRKKIVELEDVIKFTEGNIQKIDFSLLPVLELAKTKPEALKDKKGLIDKIIEKKGVLEKQRAGLLAKMAVLEERMTDKEAITIRVGDTCHSDVSVKIRESRMTLTRELTKVIFYEDTENKEVKTMPHV
ncbi:MAG: hypothetical protein A2268_02545 [Candidatus Raymondbacteria bacterium RifOxyA12_full_50_37]|uniref:Flagellar Assembly Protein A N-terminal region domain-containing protein n=1 Tax=Candidatus Raymondbacteria bacterium RIFOXYD12_FULL_49_13 TaxID=1817890 RepID=A0A1F7FEW2_UNCRA|nr:MAG: hypothetical protein A2268_02545 [Candidatus Raymondbacteria bacterium RifOxyA12_full_50_37]OGJ89122.1 MAG: hypothetical protein A2248_11220 [Candidatus Raymondbacteria bacterium RIFOXYA2_FULL_49_16]OGJ96604.1 MAG: hypothetical protein A2453_06335 [Candidatus Raymondbacteria bacterium RIFOXYC2_FULL_50_21]OGK05158.1 MAG: hypothetical protein A2519_11465 [Candidatus Raymondbacteria bacterium RIFOXYD12_FULL_49_13]OGP42164.1 MAG: hypothetical protein A2324_02060 [Candidatus Raymondbacteria 